MAKTLEVALCALFFVYIVKATTFDLEKEPQSLFVEFLESYPHDFPSQQERQRRYSVFLNNLKNIKQLNAVHDGQATFGLNEFSLMTPAEFKATRAGGVKRNYAWTDFFNVDESSMLPMATDEQVAAAPTAVDWRTRKPPVVTPVKNQRQCGDCWAFSTTGNVEGQWALSGRPLVSLSEQQLCDCDTTDHGCDGGMMNNAMNYIIRNGGIDTEASYPYRAKQGACKFNKANIGAKISSFKMIPHDPAQIAYYVANQGPVSIAVDATTWQSYKSGIIKSNCGKDLDHGVLLVGYGQQGSTPYWIVKNSWGTTWGQSGYILVSRGPGDMCGIDKFPITSIVNRSA